MSDRSHRDNKTGAMPVVGQPAEAVPFRRSEFPLRDAGPPSDWQPPISRSAPASTLVQAAGTTSIADEQTADASALGSQPTSHDVPFAPARSWTDDGPVPAPPPPVHALPQPTPPHRAYQAPAVKPPPTPRSPRDVRPPNPLEAQHRWPSAIPVATQEASTLEPEAHQPLVERRTHALEVVWKGEQEDVLGRARTWALAGKTRPRGLVPRLGRSGLVEPRPRPDDWWLGERCETVANLALGQRSLLGGDGATLERPAFVVRGAMRVCTGLSDELSAVWAALQHLSRKHRPIGEALEATRDIRGDELTPLPVLRNGLDELLTAAQSAGLKRDGLLETARHSLVRARRYRIINVLGEDHIVTSWSDGSGCTPLVGYLPVSARHHLPLVAAFEARTVATLHPRQDPEEPMPIALRLHTLGRNLSAEELGESTDGSLDGA